MLCLYKTAIPQHHKTCPLQQFQVLLKIFFEQLLKILQRDLKSYFLPINSHKKVSISAIVLKRKVQKFILQKKLSSMRDSVVYLYINNLFNSV